MFQKLSHTKIRNFLAIGLLVLVGSTACTEDASIAAALPYELESSESVSTTAVINSKPEETMIIDESSPSDLQVAPSNDSAPVALSNDSAPVTLSKSTVQVTTGGMGEAEIEDLLFMREEEKLARDVYLTLYDQWGLPLFQNIAGSEQAHTDAIKALIDQYGVDDPVGGNEVGVFTNADLQALYDQLIADGSQSLPDALRVGVAIEEIDILDLLEALANTDKADIIRVYENLLSGSENHLRAFVSTLERQTGEIYVSQYLSQEAFEAIISSSSANGGGGGYGGGGGGIGNGGGQGNGSQGNGKGQNS
jgi:hypothetical protein